MNTISNDKDDDKDDDKNKNNSTTLISNINYNISNVVRVGIGVMVINELYEIYIGIRKNSHGEGLYALPGGHLEFNETWEQCAAREVHEEMNIILPLEHIKYIHVVNDIMLNENKHYITIFMMCVVPIMTIPINNEPHKCNGWISKSWIQLQNEVKNNPNQFFQPLYQLLLNPPIILLNIMTTGDYK